MDSLIQLGNLTSVNNFTWWTTSPNGNLTAMDILNQSTQWIASSKDSFIQGKLSIISLNKQP